jgi:SET domain-containing protein
MGLYEFSSLINHSCDPNLSYEFIGDYILHVTLKRVSKNEELTDSYIKTPNKSTKQRRKEIFQLW